MLPPLPVLKLAEVLCIARLLVLDPFRLEMPVELLTKRAGEVTIERIALVAIVIVDFVELAAVVLEINIELEPALLGTLVITADIDAVLLITVELLDPVMLEMPVALATKLAEVVIIN